MIVCALGLCPATPGWGLRCVGWVSPGTCFCAVVRCGLCALPGIAATSGCCCLEPVLVPVMALLIPGMFFKIHSILFEISELSFL